MANSSLVKLKQNVGVPSRYNSGWLFTASCIANDVSKMAFAYFRYPSRPMLTIAAQVAASMPPDRDPSMPGDAYLPPVQSVMKKYWLLRSALLRNASTDVPLNP